jgi:hypothetical protein
VRFADKPSHLVVLLLRGQRQEIGMRTIAAGRSRHESRVVYIADQRRHLLETRHETSWQRSGPGDHAANA